MFIKGTNLSIDFPEKDILNDGDILPSIRFEDYSKGDNYEEDLALFNKLKRTFGLSNDIDGVVKDWDEIESVNKKS